jgi:hypothetical protein
MFNFDNQINQNRKKGNTVNSRVNPKPNQSNQPKQYAPRDTYTNNVMYQIVVKIQRISFQRTFFWILDFLRFVGEFYNS